MLDVALELFSRRGFSGTSIADLAAATGLTKAAFSYHFASKDDMLVELAEPLIADLEALVAEREELDWPEGVRSLLSDYLDVLLRHRKTAIWIDGDKSVASHEEIGARLEANNVAMRRLIAGPNPDDAKLVAASAVLGSMWRPVRVMADVDVTDHRGAVVSVALAGFER